MTNTEKTRNAAKILLELAPAIEGVNLNHLDILARIAEGGESYRLTVSFGSSPTIDLSVSGFDKLEVGVNWTAVGTQDLEATRKFSTMLTAVLELGDEISKSLP